MSSSVSTADKTGFIEPPEMEEEEGATTEQQVVELVSEEEYPILLVLKGPNKGSRYPLVASEISIGRNTDSDIFLDDITVSRKHAILKKTDRGFLIRDLGSLNGTYVNRERVEEAILKDKDELQIGRYRLIYIHKDESQGDQGS
ncbi:hypothetical protein HKBW3S09_01306 [Candidatus Hakubella thermalkaliphila]|uniref:FHA domain-containing protein n=1 Tax=Candidatus Hakubella thermalkaliphila TaxID=2754717 RepID=A0A6V8Q279_9ACTN|nr:FHA domain-containing protein [Candidatus Hakubella thermalkaliphila]GFP23841.1 hypothetical protein HKBW3S09_01306 [Candidatus Hakubella thermalkaliphila]GFP30263.1 hypothetical protein HKBW3S34_01184 [Candidatus Hakubella thermalkaliphila]GFP38869.1 hypothetical protein HKBW3S47_00569 [Candidatus Hakubella thermalkaliphila]GFP42175.1 hypothetical protein HKBW3C_01301 [Candidatus Hakubella thermalkaliphila]